MYMYILTEKFLKIRTVPKAKLGSSVKKRIWIHIYIDRNDDYRDYLVIKSAKGKIHSGLVWSSGKGVLSIQHNRKFHICLKHCFFLPCINYAIHDKAGRYKPCFSKKKCTKKPPHPPIGSIGLSAAVSSRACFAAKSPPPPHHQSGNLSDAFSDGMRCLHF